MSSQTQLYSLYYVHYY